MTADEPASQALCAKAERYNENIYADTGHENGQRSSNDPAEKLPSQNQPKHRRNRAFPPLDAEQQK